MNRLGFRSTDFGQLQPGPRNARKAHVALNGPKGCGLYVRPEGGERVTPRVFRRINGKRVEVVK